MILLMLVGLTMGGTVHTLQAQPAPDEATGLTPILKLDEIRPGMKGYGLTVFNGVDIEPFPLTVVSVQRDFDAKMGVIWVRCTGPRLAESGPVQGMSGSPIYLWSDGEEHTLGKGGKLIGAFAFGYSEQSAPIVGVQAIEQMRELRDRGETQLKAGETETSQASAGSTLRAVDALRKLNAVAKGRGLTTRATWRLEAMADLLQNTLAGEHTAENAIHNTDNKTPDNAAHAFRDVNGNALRPMMLPVNVGSADAAALANPFLVQAGMTGAFAGDDVAGRPPSYLDLEKVRFQPGSVLSVPMMWGPLDMASTGTVTDVYPDGTLVGFGHAMFGTGPIAMPLATGFVHTVMPRSSISFKISGSGVIQGALVRDEKSGVFGAYQVDPDQRKTMFETADIHLAVRMPEHPQRVYDYTAVRNRDFLPVMPALSVLRSVSAVQDMPEDSTTTVNATLRFEGDRVIQVRAIAPQGQAFDAAIPLVAPATAIMRNPHEPYALLSADITVDVELGVKSATITDARLEQETYEPGDTLKAIVQFKPYGKPIDTKTIELPIPTDTQPGQYNVMICEAAVYQSLLVRSRPHMRRTNTGQEVFEAVQQVMSIDDDDLYIVLQDQRPGVAVGRQELERLPSSRQALMLNETSTIATPFAGWTESHQKMPYVVSGVVGFKVVIEEKNAD